MTDPKNETAQKRKRGRPSTYNEEVANEICSRLADGEPLRQICRDPRMPHWMTVYAWQDRHDDFRIRIARAREMGEDAIAQECLEIADDARNDWMERNGGDAPGYALNGEHVQRSKLRIETRLKLLAKWNPRKWGEKVDVNHGGQADNPLTLLLQQLQGTRLRPKSGED